MPFLLNPKLYKFKNNIVAELRARKVPFSFGNQRLLHQIEYIKQAAPKTSCPIAEDLQPRMIFFDPLPCSDDNEVEKMVSDFVDVMKEYAAK